MRVVEVGDRDATQGLRTVWTQLQAQCPQSTPYQTWEWNEAWWRHFGARKRPRILLFYAADGADAPVAIAPLYTSFHLGTPLRRLAWLGTGVSDYLEPLTRPGYEPEVTQSLFRHINTALQGWEMADLQQLRPDTPLLACARAVEARTVSVLPMEPCPYVTLPPTWEQFTARLGKKMRSNLGYYERLLQKTFADTYGVVADATNLDAGMTALFALHQKRWNARWLPGVLGSQRVQAFHREVAARFLAQGWLRLHLLYADGDWQAALYCFAYGGRTCYYLGGFAPELARYSLGTLLTARAIKQAISEQHTEFDFLRGNEPYKYRWLPEERYNHRLLMLRTRQGMGSLGELPGRAGFALNRVERYVELRAKAFAEHQGQRRNKTRDENSRDENSKGENSKGATSLDAKVLDERSLDERRMKDETTP